MYRRCYSCTADLGVNGITEYFGVGSRLAFDPHRGRLWAVCPRCGRWNLAPIEERWEAVEEAEKVFKSQRARVHGEDIGLAQLGDGTSLIRIGEALPGEIASWRYGRTLRNRRRKAVLGAAAGTTAAVLALVGAPWIAAAGIPAAGIQSALQIGQYVAKVAAERRAVLRLETTDGAVLLRRHDIRGSYIDSDEGKVVVRLATPITDVGKWYRSKFVKTTNDGSALVMTGDHALSLLRRTMIDYNARGGSRHEVAEALGRIHSAGSADSFIASLARHTPTIVNPLPIGRNSPAYRYTPRGLIERARGGHHMPETHERLSNIDALALEMAVNEQEERRALAGELAVIREEWNEAEAIAAIADSL